MAPDFSDEPVRFSHLKAYGRSPAHGYHSRVSEWKPTQAMQMGTMVHGIWSDSGKYIAYPGAVRRGKEYDSFVAEHPDTEILLQTDYDNARFMVDALNACPDAVRCLTGIQEKTLLFDWNGLRCRATPDVRGENWLTELKTTANAAPQFWNWHFMKMAYHAQMSMQALGAPNKIDNFFIVAVESKPPYPVTIYELQERALEAGKKLLVLWSEQLKACESSRFWPGYSQSVVPLDIPEEAPELIFEEDESDG